MESQSVVSAITTEGFGNSELTFKKKVSVETTTFEGEDRTTDIYYFSGNIKKGNKTYGGVWKVEYSRITNSDKLQDSYGNDNPDYIRYLNFGVVGGIQMPLFKEYSNRFEAETTTDIPIEDYLVEATHNELFFARSCRVLNGEDKTTFHWEFGENDFYYEK